MSGGFQFDPEEVRIEATSDLPAAMAAQTPLHVEIGFGKDVRTLREAVAIPEACFLGVEISRKKVVKFCQKAAREGPRNVRAWLGDVKVLLAKLLPPGSVTEFVILFPDPWPKRHQNKHRWIQEPTARQLHAALQDGGTIIAATDHDGYAEQIERVFLVAGLELLDKRSDVPKADRSLFAQRFERQGETVTWMRWRKP